MRSPNQPRGIPSLPLALLLCLAAVPAALGATAPSPTPSGTTRKPTEYVDGVPDTGQFLPNSALLAKVADRKISVLAFRNAYFNSDPRVRPKSDSLGRAEFLTNMIRKEALGLTALSSGLPLGFEDRSTMREYQNTVLLNRLFEKEVLDVPSFSEDTLRKVHGYSQYDVRVRALSFADRAEAEAARAALVRGKTTWDALAARVTPFGGARPPRQGTWWKFDNVPPAFAVQIWPLEPGKTSPVLTGIAGYQVVQVTERRPNPRPAFQYMREPIENALKSYASGLRRMALMREAKRGMTIQYDTTNAKWAASRFFAAVQSDTAKGGGIVIDERVPEFSSEDTARVIVSWDGGRVTLGQVVQAFTSVPAIYRPVINTPELLMDFADTIMLEPRLLDLALQRGLEKDTLVLQRLENKREEMLVTQMVEDSCFARIRITPKERRDYYQAHRSGFMSYPKVRAAFVVRDTKEAADSVLARLAAGESIAGVLRADSLRGEARSGTQLISSQDYHPLHKLLFEEMRPGQRRVMGPDKGGYWACVQMLDFDPGQLLPFEQVESMIDDSIRNEKGEQALNEFADRLAKRYPVERHFERLMSVKLTTPGANERE